MNGMGHVKAPARQHVDGRPFQPMPEKVEESNGNAAIDEDGVSEIAIGWQAILPGAREQRELELRAVGRKQSQERFRELVYILADTGSLPERGTVVQQGPHLPKN